MPREILKGDRAKSLPAPTCQSAPDFNGRERLLTPTETAKFLRVSPSWLAKARMTGNGPPFIKLGRSVRYEEGALALWMKSRLRLSTSQL
jgi:hypothetical protein